LYGIVLKSNVHECYLSVSDPGMESLLSGSHALYLSTLV